MDILDIIVRLVVATAVGAVLGLNRDLHGKPTGVRTLGLVGLGSALVVLAVTGSDPGAVSRVIQGIVTGIGFLGAGVIIRPLAKSRVHGLTTAACVWLTAVLGAACGTAAWGVLVIGLPLAFLVLMFGKRLEDLSHHVWSGAPDEPEA